MPQVYVEVSELYPFYNIEKCRSDQRYIDDRVIEVDDEEWEKLKRTYSMFWDAQHMLRERLDEEF